MKRVLVIGSCGSGKSVFSRRLGQITGLPVIHLDREFWRAGWVEPSPEVWEHQVDELVQRGEWIIDGNYSRTMERRLAACDTVFFLDMSRYLCIWSVIKRNVQYRGRTRPDIHPGCPEKIDWAFVKWTWNYPTRSRPRVLEKLSRAPHASVTTFRNRDESERYLNELERNYHERADS